MLVDKEYIDNILEDLVLSPSGIKSFESCRAGYIYSKVIFPRTETERSSDITSVGRIFHEMAETSFDEDVETRLTVYEKEKTKGILEEFKNILTSRDYYDKPSVKEEFLRLELPGLGTLVGVPDRVVDWGDKISVVDYKTSAFCYPDRDKKQVLTYAYMLWKLKDMDPDSMEIILDYVRADEVFKYKINKSDLERHENYLISRFRGVRKLLESFSKDMNIKKISHSPGNCGLCYMNGICLPYTIMLHPTPDPLEPENISTESLIREKISREEIRKLNEERIKAINRTLMFRYDSQDSDPEDEEGRSFKDVIEEYLVKIQSSIDSYNTEAVVKKIVNRNLHKMVKGTPFSELVDMEYLEKEVVKIMTGFLPGTVSKENVPEDLRSKLDEYRIRGKRAPYLKQKS